MLDARWIRLKDCLLDRGWTSREDALCAPHETMSFARSSDDASLAAFRDTMVRAAEASAAYAGVDDDHADLHDDLISLVDALDEVFAN
jgi:hypothetical protein